MFCTNCGKETPEGTAVCPNCGKAISQPAAAIPAATAKKFCRNCGAMMEGGATVCPACGASQMGAAPAGVPPGGGKDFLTALLLCIFVGWIGAHRFYTGHTGIGIVQALTLGGCGIWALIDLIMIATGSYRDANGYPLVKH